MVRFFSPEKTSIGSSDLHELLTPEELRNRQHRGRLLWGLPLLGVLLICLYLGAAPLAHVVKGWQSRRLAKEAFALMGDLRWAEALKKAQDAYLLRPVEPEASRAIGAFLSRTGQPAAALEWWHNLDKLTRLTAEDRRTYASDALSVGNLGEARSQIGILTVGTQPLDPAVLLLISQLASRQDDPERGTDYALRALRDPQSKPHQKMAAILQLYALNSTDSAEYVEARSQLIKMARASADPISLDALILLARVMPPAPASSQVLSVTTNAMAVGMSLAEIATAIEGHPGSSAADRLVALGLRVRLDPARADAVFAEAIQRFGDGDDETVAALARFLNAQNQHALTIEVISPERAQKTRPLALAYLDALASLGRWSEAKEILASSHLPLDPVARNLYSAAASMKQDEPQGAASQWDQALLAAGANAVKLTEVGDYAERQGAISIADQAFTAAIKADPTMRPAYVAQRRLAHVRGETVVERNVLAQIVGRWPDDVRARGDEVYLSLLLDGSIFSAKAAAQSILPQALKQPPDWPARATLAFARLRQGERSAALAAFSGDRGTMDPHAHPGEDVPAGAQAVWAATLEANGWKTEAEAAALEAAKKSLLPQERDLIASLLTK